ncbi:MAG: EAL domain-containing protein [Actinomycetota bacterium]
MAGERGRDGGLPLTVYVIALVLIPLAGVGMFGVRELQTNNADADEAARLAEAATAQADAAWLLVEIVGDATEFFAAAPDDRAATADDLPSADLRDAFARMERYVNSDRALEPRYGVSTSDARKLLDDQFAVISTGEREASLIDGGLAIAIPRVRDLIEVLDRQISDADPTMVTGALDDLDVLVGLALTAQAEASALLALEPGSPDGVIEYQAAIIRHSDAIVLAAEQLGANTFSSVSERPAIADLSTAPTADDLAERTVETADHITEIESIVRTVGRDISASVDAAAAEIDDRNTTTVLVFSIVTVLSLAFGVIVLRSFVPALRRLRERAERIGRGELINEPLPVVGPSDVRRVTTAVNGMAETLTLVDRQLRALAADAGEEVDLQHLPGDVGASVRTSVARVSELTSRLQASEMRLAEEARVDTLTGLPNRFAVLERLDRLVRSPSDVLATTGLMFLDIDGFKSVNDTHGHAVGDAVLREIAQRLNAVVRDSDFVARLGGDEFLIMVGDMATTDGLSRFGERMINEIERPFPIGDRLFAISASVGVTMLEPGDESQAAIRRADAAVYQAKSRGRRRVESFDSELQETIEQQAELELALRQAIQHHELRMYLQPMADLRTGYAAAAEALVRWERPGHGLVPPGEFIPIAERSGLIFELERWVLDAACTRVAEWKLRGRGGGLRIAVNISGRHLIEGDLVSDLDSAIAATGADPSLLEIELTETHLLDDVARASAVLSSIRERGVKVAIDDFGTGYSSMTYLQKLPVDIVKIDRSFISSATSNDFDSTIVESVVTIGNALDLEVVAEGIETIEQLQYAIEAGIDYGQGFLFARPTPAADAESAMFGGPMFDRDRVRSSTIERHPSTFLGRR